MKYGIWDKSFSVEKDEQGRICFCCSPGLAWHEKEYVGEGLPSACQAMRQQLLLGSYNAATREPLKDNDVLFGIRGINNSYDDWTGDPFQDYDIDIIQGSEEEVRQFFDASHKSCCVIGCDQCNGCGDW